MSSRNLKAFWPHFKNCKNHCAFVNVQYKKHVSRKAHKTMKRNSPRERHEHTRVFTCVQNTHVASLAWEYYSPGSALCSGAFPYPDFWPLPWDWWCQTLLSLKHSLQSRKYTAHLCQVYLMSVVMVLSEAVDLHRVVNHQLHWHLCQMTMLTIIDTMFN